MIEPLIKLRGIGCGTSKEDVVQASASEDDGETMHGVAHVTASGGMRK